MPQRPEGVYQDQSGQWYFKVTIGRDALSGRRDQVTRRGFRTAAEAAKARRELVAKADAGLIRPSRAGLTLDELLDLYLDGIDADRRLSAKTCHDYRVYAATYVRPLLGKAKVRDVTAEVVMSWQRKLIKEGGTKSAKPLSPNTIRLARAPLAGAFKLALQTGIVSVNPLSHVPRPTPRRSVPRSWTPEQARQFLSLMENDRTWPIWAFLLGCGLRIGELVSLRWDNVDLAEGAVRVVEFSSYLGHEWCPPSARAATPSAGWTSTTSSSRCSVRSAPCRLATSWRRRATNSPLTSSPSPPAARTTRSTSPSCSPATRASSACRGSPRTGSVTPAPR